MTSETAVDGLWELVGEWSTIPDVADLLGIEVTRVRQLVRDGSVLSHKPADGPLSIPSLFVADGRVVKGLEGVITLLRDARYDDVDALRWLFTPEGTLPGTPIQALVENRGTEVKRRAQALGF